MKRTIAALIMALVPLAATAAGGHGAHLESPHNDLEDKASLQRGARLFVNYCLSCHSMGYMRYNRMGADLGLSDQQVSGNLMFASQKVGELMKVSMRREDAERWFGVAPPDLTLVARSRGTDWLYTYLISFYDDPSRPWGVNNLVFPNVGMPHVLWKLQGQQAPIYEEVDDGHGGTTRHIKKLELVRPGVLSEKEYQAAMRDLVNFMEYASEPMKLERQGLGVWVLLFLIVFFAVSYALKREYWKDVH